MLNIVLVLLVVGFIANFIYRLPKFNDGESAPSFKAQLMDGSQFDLAELRGSYVLLDFWGSWCGPCRRENPKIVELQQAFANEKFVDADGFTVISIAIETNENSWKRAIEKDNLNWKHHIVQLDRFKSEIAMTYGVKEIPTKYLLDPEGNIISVNESAASISAFLESKKK